MGNKDEEKDVKYLKLGKKATLFHDPLTQIVIRNKEVVKVRPEAIDKKSIAEALQGGHIVEANKLDYDNHQENLRKNQPHVEDDQDEESTESDDEDDEEEDDDEDLTRTELMDLIRDNEKIPAEEKKALAQRKQEDLLGLYKKYKEPKV